MKIEWPYKSLWKSANRRLRGAAVGEAAALEEVARLKEMLYEVIPEQTDEPLYRRITNQRRSLKQLHADNKMWKRFYEEEYAKRKAAESLHQGLPVVK